MTAAKVIEEIKRLPLGEQVEVIQLPSNWPAIGSSRGQNWAKWPSAWLTPLTRRRSFV